MAQGDDERSEEHDGTPTAPDAAITALLLRARALAGGGDIDGALATANRALDIDTSREESATLLVEILGGAGRGADAVGLVQDLMARNPGQLWPYRLAATACSYLLEKDDPQAGEALEGVAGARDERSADQGLRVLLRKAMLWQELARHLDYMSGRTLVASEQVGLFEELADLQATKLSSPLDARDARAKADRFRDLPGLAQYYWQSLGQNPGDEEVWQEVAEFFRANGLWSDVAELLHRSIEGASGPELVALYDELVDAYAMIEPPRWETLIQLMRDETSRTLDLQTREALEQRIAEVNKRMQRKTTRPAPAREATAPTEGGGGSLRIAIILLLVLLVLVLLLYSVFHR